ncbi:acetoacetyl-CoA reductase [Desulfosarcina ovata subsp. sediminis]|uniref:Acetoacetyl-CoA reductase n=1 Tax=Desulfosarcina ovata subsp. sediminis TaxID=885957 RepID=A0A5K7ZQL6_9BACT|nr:glucose 1-dehydrogenase [Desulfosarcina ovata]BBO82030.1 acetoacetyl-CoA reductase [Desulfosarcina ovata subsp. sediminis]
MDLGLTQKTVIVTGGASNIGRAISLGFAREGANVIIADIDENQANKTVEEANSSAGRAVFYKTDLTNVDMITATVKKAAEEFGGIDVLVNNVGWEHTAMFTEKSLPELQKEADLTLWSMVNCTKAVLPLMMERKRGAIVSIGSDAGRVGQFKQVFYSGCKGAVIAMSKSIAQEVGRLGIRINVVSPGATFPAKSEDIGDNSLWQVELPPEEVIKKIAKAYPLGRIGRAEDTANAVLFLASDAADWITGQTLSVNGGWSMI